MKAYRHDDGGSGRSGPRPTPPASRGPRAGSRCPSWPRPTSSRASRRSWPRTGPGCPAGGRDQPLPAPVHVRLRGRSSACAPPSRSTTCASPPRPAPTSPAGRAGLDLALAGLHPGRVRRHRRGQVRRQLRREPGRAVRGDRARLRPGVLPRRDRAALGRGARRHEPVLRARRRHAGHPRAHRHDPRGHHPLVDPRSSRGTPATRSSSAGSASRSGARAPRRARSARCSRAAPPRSSPRSAGWRDGETDVAVAGGRAGEVTMRLRQRLARHPVRPRRGRARLDAPARVTGTSPAHAATGAHPATTDLRRDVGDDVHVYDTTLRDGAQQEGLSLSVADKLAIAGHLDELGVGFIEGGWPGAMPEGHRVLRARRHRAEAAQRDPGRLRRHPARRAPRPRRPAGARAARLAGPGGDARGEERPPPRRAGAAHHARGEPRDGRATPWRSSPARAGACSSTPSTSSTATPRPGLRRSRSCGPPSRPAPRSSRSATPTAACCRRRSPTPSAR